MAPCFGWVGSKPDRLDVERTLLWFAPRKPGTGGSRPNKQRVERMIDAGLMAQAGWRKEQQARLDGSRNRLDAVGELEIPDDLRQAVSVSGARSNCGQRGGWLARDAVAVGDILCITVHHVLGESQMEYVYMPLQLAPGNFNQPILPNWSFNLFNVNLGASSNAAIEQDALQKVGSYGKQIGHLAEALELLVGKLRLLESPDLSQAEKDTLTVFLGDVASIRKIKNSHA